LLKWQEFIRSSRWFFYVLPLDNSIWTPLHLCTFVDNLFRVDLSKVSKVHSGQGARGLSYRTQMEDTRVAAVDSL